MTGGFYCQTCGQHHADMPMAFGADAPVSFYAISESERKHRCDLTSEICVIDEKEFYVRGNLNIPVVDGQSSFVWGVWISVSEKSLRRMGEMWETPGRETAPPYFGWLCTSLPLYPNTLSLKTHVHTRPLGERPFVELEPTDHPLAVEQRTGITMKRVQEIVEQLMHENVP